MKDIALIQRRLEEYRCTSADEEMNAIREMLQEMVLAGLSRTDFFVKAAFHGGTQLRIFEGVRRFSEDLDFALVSQDLSLSGEYGFSATHESAGIAADAGVDSKLALNFDLFAGINASWKWLNIPSSELHYKDLPLLKYTWENTASAGK